MHRHSFYWTHFLFKVTCCEVKGSRSADLQVAAASWTRKHPSHFRNTLETEENPSNWPVDLGIFFLPSPPSDLMHDEDAAQRVLAETNCLWENTREGDTVVRIPSDAADLHRQQRLSLPPARHFAVPLSCTHFGSVYSIYTEGCWKENTLKHSPLLSFM